MSVPTDHTRTSPTRPVVAGFDGSECSLHAAQWAAAEAERWGTGLVLVHAAVPPDRSGARVAAAVTVESGAAQRARPPAGALPRSAEQPQSLGLLATAARRVRAEHPALRVTTVMGGAPAAAALLQRSESALLTVVGAWGNGRAPGAPLGSVAFSVASTARTPVAVVGPQHTPAARCPVALAVDGRSPSPAAVDFAFAAADARNVRLLVLHVRHDASIDGAYPYQVVRPPLSATAGPVPSGPADTQEDRAALMQQLLPWQRRYRRVHITPVVLFGSPTATLLDFSRTTGLLVIGDAGRGVNSGLMLGSTGQALLHRSACPVVVARSPRGDP